MLVNSVTLVLQETLEAALLISVLLSISYQRRFGISWLGYGLVGGALLATVYAFNMATISAWFDYVGQEVFNAALQIGIAALIPLYGWLVFVPGNGVAEKTADAKMVSGRAAVLTGWSAAIIVMLAISREGSEVALYISGFFLGSPHLASVLSGSVLGFGIGLSMGTLLFFALSSDQNRWRRRVAMLLLALFAGNMLSQSVAQLTQADWITVGGPYWDTSGWISEQSITGQLLYASLGYEATPSGQQLLAYLAGTLLVLGLLMGRRLFFRLPIPESTNPHSISEPPRTRR